VSRLEKATGVFMESEVQIRCGVQMGRKCLHIKYEDAWMKKVVFLDQL